VEKVGGNRAAKTKLSPRANGDRSGRITKRIASNEPINPIDDKVVDIGRSTSAAVNDYAYTLWIEPVEDGAGDSFAPSGWVKNTGTLAWTLGFNIGIHNFRDINGQPVACAGFRGEFASRPVHPGDEVFFWFDIDTAEIPSRAVSCEIDMVHENVRWFNEGADNVHKINLTGFKNNNSRGDTISALMAIYRTAKPTERQKIKVITDVLKAYDFSEFGCLQAMKAVARGISMNEPYKHPAVSSSTIESIEAKRKCNHSSAFINGYANKQANIANADSKPVELFKKFVYEKEGFFRGGTPPIPARLANFLNGRALPPDLAHSPVTRGMMATLGQTGPISFNGDHEFSELSWRYLTSILIDNSLPISLIPDSISREFASSPSKLDENCRFPRPTKFMLKLLSDNSDYRARYDIETDVGCCAFAFDLVSLGAENEVRRHFLGQDILDWLRMPVGPSLPLSPFEILAMANFALRGTEYLVNSEGPNGKMIQSLRRAYDWLPAPFPVAAYDLRVIGLASGSSGLATNMKMSVDVLKALNISVEQVDAESGRVIPARRAGQRTLRQPVDLYHLNCDDLPSLVARYSTHDRPTPYRIGFALWESSAMPEEHRAGALLMDELWVPTKYIEDVYLKAGFKNVKIVGKGIDLGTIQHLDRRIYDIEENDFVFLTSFDLDSWVERKNPAAVVSAFMQAFPNDALVKLVIKTTGIFAHDGDRTGQIAKILSAADADPRIVLINERAPFSKYLGIIGMADALVSSHRSEGFGYLPAYAMLQKLPVIVTDHSGTEDFCDNTTSFPVSCDLVEIKRGDFVYHADGARWADVHVSSLAEAMVLVRTNYEEARKRAKLGYETVSRLYSMKSMCERYEQNLATMIFSNAT